jgi:hypothetical protein
MGYEIRITRRDEWFEHCEPAISLDEWLALVRDDPELRLDGFAIAPLPDGGAICADEPSMAVWIAHPEHGQRIGMAWIWHSRGNIVAKNPDEAMRCKMWKLAQRLNARVQGDELELYGADGQVIAESTQ